MAKIFIYGERLIGSVLGYLSIDEGAEQKIPSNGTNLSKYEYPISPGKHSVSFYTEGKFSRTLAEVGDDGSFLGTLGSALSTAQTGSFEYDVTFGEESVLVLHVVEKVTKTYIEYMMANEETCAQLWEEAKAESGCTATTSDTPTPEPGQKSKWTTFLLCLFLGVLGVHKFYERKTGMGVLYLLTLGLFGIGVIVDLIKIARRPS